MKWPEKFLLTTTALLVLLLVYGTITLARRVYLLENAVYGKIPAAELAKKGWPLEGD